LCLMIFSAYFLHLVLIVICRISVQGGYVLLRTLCSKYNYILGLWLPLR
jgi:hypothetical protein